MGAMTKDEFRAQWAACTTPEERRELVITHLDAFQETNDPCKNGHVEHSADDHLGRKTVHSMSGGGGLALGADWDYESAAEFIRKSVRMGPAGQMAQATGHPMAFVGGEGPDKDRVIAFAMRFDDDTR